MSIVRWHQCSDDSVKLSNVYRPQLATCRDRFKDFYAEASRILNNGDSYKIDVAMQYVDRVDSAMRVALDMLKEMKT